MIRRLLISLLHLGLILPTMVVPIPLWHHHDHAESTPDHHSNPASHTVDPTCQLCLTAPVMTTTLVFSCSLIISDTWKAIDADPPQFSPTASHWRFLSRGPPLIA
ncbi:MAG: hypothetical protein HJJLKODD_01388 [Phycisphaerae bacterium]|nr:hypothetical protein [Phycisphaerae bacterium]